MEPSDIKALAPTQCPHCKGEIVVEFRSTAPQLTSVFTPQEINGAKETTIQRLNILPISAERKQELLAWLRDPDVIFSPNDVSTILANVIDETQHDITKEDTA